MKKQVVIIGGGYGGLEAAKQLDKTRFDVTIVDAKPYFEHVIGVYYGVRYNANTSFSSFQDLTIASVVQQSGALLALPSRSWRRSAQSQHHCRRRQGRDTNRSRAQVWACCLLRLPGA